MIKKLIHICLMGASVLVLSACGTSKDSPDNNQNSVLNQKNASEADLTNDETSEIGEEPEQTTDLAENAASIKEDSQEEGTAAVTSIPEAGSQGKNSANSSEESNQGDQEDNDYHLTRMDYVYNDIQAYYPVLTDGFDDQKRDDVNELIYKDLNDIIKIYSGTIEPSKALEEAEAFQFVLSIDYEIKLQNSDYLSIYYIADYSSETAAYPSQTIYTTNIDLKNLKKLNLNDIVLLDENFAPFLKGWDFKAIEENNKDLNDAIKDYISNLSNKDLLDGLLKADQIGANTSGIFSYLTEDGLGISIPVPHVMGDHVEFEKDYDKLDNHLKMKIK